MLIKSLEYCLCLQFDADNPPGRSGWTVSTTYMKCLKMADNCGSLNGCTRSSSCSRGTCTFGEARQACKAEARGRVRIVGIRASGKFFPMRAKLLMLTHLFDIAF